jgi:hypothetical protein
MTGGPRPWRERFPITWNCGIEKESLGFKELAHAGIGKVDQFYWDLIFEAILPPAWKFRRVNPISPYFPGGIGAARQFAGGCVSQRGGPVRVRKMR